MHCEAPVGVALTPFTCLTLTLQVLASQHRLTAGAEREKTERVAERLCGLFTLSHGTAPPLVEKRCNCSPTRTTPFFYKLTEELIFFVKSHSVTRTFPEPPPAGHTVFDDWLLDLDLVFDELLSFMSSGHNNVCLDCLQLSLD